MSDYKQQSTLRAWKTTTNALEQLAFQLRGLKQNKKQQLIIEYSNTQNKDDILEPINIWGILYFPIRL